METLQQIQDALDTKFGGQVKLLSARKDGTVNVKGLWERRTQVRFFLKRMGLECLNDVAEERGYSAVIGIA